MSILFFCSLWTAQAEDLPTEPFRANLNVGGMMIMGNFNQIQINGGGLISYSQEKYGDDIVLNGYRMWTKIPDTGEYLRIGDNLNIANIGYYYVRPKLYIQGFGGYATSQLHQIDDRYVTGISAGFTPIREKNRLFRASLGGFWEHSSYPSNDFNLDTQHDDAVRSLPRIGVISNGWYRIPENRKISFRYIAWFYINPIEPKDYRYRINGEINYALTTSLALRTSTTYEHSSVVVQGVSEYDMRTSLGLSITLPAKQKQ